jgi:Fe-S-cluster containining protein
MQKYENVIFPDVQFECKHCEKCCHVSPDVSRKEFDMILAAKKDVMDLHGFMDLSSTIPMIATKEDGSCFFLSDKKLCKIHDVKPLGCRFQPFIIVDCTARKKPFKIELSFTSDCPGVTQGKMTKDQLVLFGKAAQEMFDFLVTIESLCLKLPKDDERVARSLKKRLPIS